MAAQTLAPAPPETPAAAPVSASPSAADTAALPRPAATPTKPAGAAVFPHAVAAKYASEKPGRARMHTCRDQYRANKAANENGGLKWIKKGGGYYSQCLKTLKG